MSRGISQESAVSPRPRRRLGSVTIDRCNDCPRYMITLCQHTGRKIKLPMSGAIPKDCPLKKVKRG